MALGIRSSWNSCSAGIYGFSKEWDLSFGLLHVQYGKPTELERLVHFTNPNTIKPDVPTLKVGFHFVSYNSDTVEHDI